MVFKNEQQLKKILLSKCAKAVANVENEVCAEFDWNLNQFYSEFKPAEYIRTFALADSLEATNVATTGNGVFAEVRFNTPSYKNGIMQLQSGRTGYAAWSGEKVLDTAMHGSHGGYVDGTAIWYDGMNSLGGEQGIKNMLKQELKKQGL